VSTSVGIEAVRVRGRVLHISSTNSEAMQEHSVSSGTGADSSICSTRDDQVFEAECGAGTGSISKSVKQQH
jgi:hypothetical protein